MTLVISYSQSVVLRRTSWKEHRTDCFIISSAAHLVFYVCLTYRWLCWPPKRATTTAGAATTSYRCKPDDIPVSDHGNHACLLLPIVAPREPASTSAVGSSSNLHSTMLECDNVQSSVVLL